MNDVTLSGLFVSDDRPVPLEGVKIDARLRGLATEVTVAQRYRNREDVPVEAVYVFPLEEGSAVCAFEARVDGRIVRGRVEERDDAFEIYDDAMADGHGAFLLDQERPNVFTASVGNLRPGEAIELRITYVALARHEGSDLRFMIPTTVSPRYAPPAAGPEIGQPDAERVNPERWLEVPYGLELVVDIETDSAVRRVESPSHPVRTTLSERGARVELARQEAALDRDFVLLVATASTDQPALRTARFEGETFVQLSFRPDFSARDEGGSEVLFLLDCSASMGGDSIDQARRALALSIRALGEGDTFNILRFGSTFESLWSKPRAFDETTLEEATGFIHRAAADLGGTEILAPLKKLLERRPDRRRRRQILLLTDGEVANERDIVELAGRRRDAARVFTFGIGAGSSEYLVRELARVTRGAAEFIFPGERIEPKVLRMFGRVRAPALDDVQIDWGGLGVEQAPAEVPPVFDGDDLVVFGRVPGGRPRRVTLTAGGASWSLDVDGSGESLTDSRGPIPILWAREMIRDLERGTGSRRGSGQERALSDRRRQRLLDLGRRFGLMSSATSYVAVEERELDERTTSSAELRKIPVALTMGWGGQGRLTRRHDLLAGAPARLPAPASAPPGRLVAGLNSTAVMAADATDPMESALAAGSVDGKSFMETMAGTVSHWVDRFKQPSRKLPVTPRAVPSPEPPADRLYTLLMTQKADGRFELSPVLEEWLGAALGEVRHAVAEHGEAVVATTLVLALLERDEASRADEWRPAARKARSWLEQQPVLFAPGAILGASRVAMV